MQNPIFQEIILNLHLLYTLRKKNNPMIDTYSEAGKVQIVRNTDIFIPKIVGSDAGYLINDTNA